MKLPASVERSAAKFDAMSVRERALVAAATAAAVLMIWAIAVHDPMQAKQRALSLELASAQESLLSASAGSTAETPAARALGKEAEINAELAAINSKLESEAAGLIPPERMVEVIHDVLTRQRGVKLISLHNKPVTSLVQRSDRDETRGAEKAAGSAEESGPYMHPVEIVIEGSYLDILAYLRALEALPWHFYWKRLDLTSVEYPRNRVRIELGTLSMEKEWIGV